MFLYSQDQDVFFENFSTIVEKFEYISLHYVSDCGLKIQNE